MCHFDSEGETLTEHKELGEDSDNSWSGMLLPVQLQIMILYENIKPPAALMYKSTCRVKAIIKAFAHLIYTDTRLPHQDSEKCGY